MDATFQMIHINTEDVETLKRKYRLYDGQLKECKGLVVTHYEFTCEEDAKEWLMNNTEKLEEVRAVKVIDENGDFCYYIGGWCSK